MKNADIIRSLTQKTEELAHFLTSIAEVGFEMGRGSLDDFPFEKTLGKVIEWLDREEE